MTDEQYAANRSAGRGALIKLLRETHLQSTSSESSDEQNKSQLTSSVGIDSGVGSSSGGRVTGRGRLVSLLSSNSNSNSNSSHSLSDEPTAIVAGRAKKLEFLRAAESATGAIRKTYNPSSEQTEENTQPIQRTSIEKHADIERESQSEVEPHVVHKTGTYGAPIKLVTNYLPIQCDPNMGVFEYEVKFDSNIHDMRMRYKLLAQHSAIIGKTKTFDGVVLYLPSKLPDDITTLQCVNERDNTTPTIRIVFKRKKLLRDCIHLYNVLFARIFKVLNYVTFGRKDFDPSAAMNIPQQKLEVWPGYVTAVDEYEGGVMLCLDASHRVLCQTTVLEVLKDIYRKDPQNYQKNCAARLIGAVVLTRYNNRTYTIMDINFEGSPMDTFEMAGRTISYFDYYKEQYNINIMDRKQPLLLNIQKRRIIGKAEKEEITFCLIPEICFLTGLTDEMRQDFKVMRDIATFTKITPNQRMLAFKKYSENVNTVPEARDILGNWGLTLSCTPLEIFGRQFGMEEVMFANRSFSAGQNADFGKFSTNNELLNVVHLRDWLLIHCRCDKIVAKTFIDLMERNAKPMGIHVAAPRVEVLNEDRTDLYVQTLRRCITAQLQIVVIICPTSRDDRYAAIKKICCAEIPIPSQVILSRNLKSDKKNRSVVQKVALQMNCKLGGTLWSIKIPFKNVMICGIDSFHDSAKQANSVSAFVASLNGEYTRWFSQAGIQSQKEEFVNGLCVAMVNALQTYKRMNLKLPDKIIIFRDGVSDGQLHMCQEYEIPQLKNACSLHNPAYNPEFTFIVVQKRINSRLFAVSKGGLENPLPGCVVDHTITRRYLYDFFLVPQSVQQGTVSPTHYIVAYDSANFSPDILQRLSYKLCFMYYNWPGTVRVPACCQYAHKLAYLVGQSVKRQPSERLNDKLYYL